MSLANFSHEFDISLSHKSRARIKNIIGHEQKQRVNGLILQGNCRMARPHHKVCEMSSQFGSAGNSGNVFALCEAEEIASSESFHAENSVIVDYASVQWAANTAKKRRAVLVADQHDLCSCHSLETGEVADET
jgi:hypothetical protein